MFEGGGEVPIFTSDSELEEERRDRTELKSILGLLWSGTLK